MQTSRRIIKNLSALCGVAIAATVVPACVAPNNSATNELAQGVTTVGPYTISMSPNAPLVQGTRATFTITAENDTTSAANLAITAGFGTDTINVVPAGCVKIGPSILDCSAVPVAPGASVTYSPQVTPANAGTVTYSAEDLTVADGVTSTQESVTDTETVAPGPTDLQVTGSSNQGAPPVGTAFTYTFQVKNNGPLSTASASFSDPLPTSLTLSSVTTDTGTCTADTTVSCALGSLAVGAQATIRINVAPNVATTIVNTATASLPADQSDRNPANNSVSVTVTSH